jgi:hypothetical protein
MQTNESTALAIQSRSPEPKGFDSGLQCLAAVFAFTLAVRFGIGSLIAMQSPTLLKVGLAVVFIGLGVLIVVSTIVWGRRHISARPPRRWAVLIAMIWASLQLLSYLFLPFRALGDTPSEQANETFQQDGQARLESDGGTPTEQANGVSQQDRQAGSERDGDKSTQQVNSAFQQDRPARLQGDGESASNIADGPPAQFDSQASQDGMMLTFRPPEGTALKLHRERTINTVSKQTAQFDVENTDSVMAFVVSGDTYRVSEVARRMSRTIDGKPFDNPTHKYLVGKTNTLIISADGELVRTEGRENLVEEIKAFVPIERHTELERQLGGDRPFLQEQERWHRNVQRFIGRIVKEGDAWKESMALPSAPNARPKTAHRANRVEKIQSVGQRTFVTIVTFQSSEADEIDNLDFMAVNMTEGIKFIRAQPPRMPFWRTIHSRTFEVSTMLPVQDERVWRGSEWKSTEWILVTERQVERYQRIR